ncbi:hypothetical protein [Campylobacter taeniopygiae]|uniref:Uncharacterized protein n=1 Tax=Campylobacter taeniopygiae TaxID=2510188 RepID=A0ABY2TK07_9BACT|nr:hypothetical protein [Campylobacter taeniopygiae]TKX33218.1 hypothetical protein CQA75_08685 [Campylobacter taeniopygiae]
MRIEPRCCISLINTCFGSKEIKLNNDIDKTEKALKLFGVNPNDLQNNLKLENNNYIARFRYDTKRIKAQLNIKMDLKKT